MIKELMRDAFDVNASDIHLTVGLPPMFRVNGVLRQAGEELLRREDTYNMAMELMDDRRRTQFLDNGEADFSYEIENVCRFRVNVFKQSNCVAAALRLISNNIPSFEDLRVRLHTRNTDDPVEIERRLKNARGEVQKIDRYQYAVVNDNLELAFAQLQSIANAEKHRTTRFHPHISEN